MTCEREWRLLTVLYDVQESIPEVELLIASRDFFDPRAGRLFSRFISSYGRRWCVPPCLFHPELRTESESYSCPEIPFSPDDYPWNLARNLFQAAEDRRRGLACLVDDLPRDSRVIVASWPGLDLSSLVAELRSFRKLADIRTFHLRPVDHDRRPRLADLLAVTDIQYKTQGIVFLYDGMLIVAKNAFGPIGTFGKPYIHE